MNANHAALIFNSKWFYRALHILGFTFLVDYLWLTEDWRLSIGWGGAYFVIVLVVSHSLTKLGTSRRFQKLNKYLTYPSGVMSASKTQSKNEWAIIRVRYLQGFFKNGAILLAPTEDALVCVPVLLAGISPLSALLGGMVFGAIHLGGYSYIECIAKGISYALIVWIILPHGLLTVILGHLIADAVGFVVLRIAVRQLSKNVELQAKRNERPD